MTQVQEIMETERLREEREVSARQTRTGKELEGDTCRDQSSGSYDITVPKLIH